MNIEKIILLLINLAGDNLSGKTLLQKQMYFLSVLLEEDFGYNAHYYGPYSQSVDDNLVKLKVLGFVKEEAIYLGSDNVGFDKKIFQYSLLDNGKKILKNYKSENLIEFNKISSFVEKLKSAGNFDDYVSLSIAAKTYYIIEHSGETPVENITEIAKQYGWNNISDDSIRKAIKFLKNLKLIEVH